MTVDWPWRRWPVLVAPPVVAGVVAVATAVVLATALIAAVGQDPLTGFAAWLDGAFAGVGLGNLQATINRAAMIVGATLAAGVALRCGFLNIGVEGQMVLGGVTAALVAVHAPLPGPLAAPAALVAGAAAGGLWALLAGVMQFRLGVPLLIASLLLNYPASYLASWLVSHPFRDVASGMAASGRVPEAARLATLGGSDVQITALFVVLVAAALGVFFRRTTWGYEARMTGLSAGFARASGVRVERLGLAVVGASGAIAGLLGGLAVLAEHHRYIDGMLVKPLYAWTGIMAVLLGGSSIVGWVASGCLFAALYTGAMGMERAAEIPREIARVILAGIILVVAGRGSANLPGERS